MVRVSNGPGRRELGERAHLRHVRGKQRHSRRACRFRHGVEEPAQPHHQHGRLAIEASSQAGTGPVHSEQ